MSHTTPIRLFISYSHKDAKWLQQVQTHLKPVLRGGEIDAWADTRLRASQRWRDEIDQALATANAAILLVSPDFYASDFITQHELPPILRKAEQEGAKVFILVIDHCHFDRDPALNCFQTIHDPKPPLAAMNRTERNRVLSQLAKEVQDLRPRPTSAAPTAPAPAAAPGQPTPGPQTNPYDPYHAVTPPLFVGREAELRDLAVCLDRRQSVSLVGDWRIGKSSLLATWALRARAQGRVVVELNGQGEEGGSVAALVQRITGRACTGDADAAATQLDSWVQAQGSGLAPLLLLDEADRLLKLDHRFWARVRGMLDRCSWVLATRAEIVEQSPDSPLANQMHLVRLGLLDAASANALVALGQFAPNTAALMHSWAGRHPFYLQLLGYCMQEANGDENAALDRFQDVANMRLREWWKCLPEREQQALKDWRSGQAAKRPALRRRGFVDDQGMPFGQVLVNWLGDLE